MEKWACTICGYIYNPEIGDIENKIEVGTKFEDIPKEWVCPICNASKEHFEKI